MTLPRLPADPIWDQYLEPDEFLVWHGRPDGEKLISQRSTRKAASGLSFAIFAGVMIWVIGDDLFSPGGQLLWFVIGALLLGALWLFVGSHFQDRKRRRGTWYTLTNKRAFIATDLGSQRIKSYPIKADTDLRFVPAADGEHAYIYFAQEVIKARKRDESDTIIPIGFALVDDGAALWDLFQRVQRGEE